MDAAVAVSAPVDALKPASAVEELKLQQSLGSPLSSGSDNSVAGAAKRKGGRPRSDMQHLKANPWQQKQITFLFKKGELVPQAGDRAKARKEARERRALENYSGGSQKKAGAASGDAQASANTDSQAGEDLADSSSSDPDAPGASASLRAETSSSQTPSKKAPDSPAALTAGGSGVGSASQQQISSSPALSKQSLSLDSVVSATTFSSPPSSLSQDAKPDKKQRLTASNSNNNSASKQGKTSSWTIEGTGARKRKGNQISDKFRISSPQQASPAQAHRPIPQSALMGKAMHVVHDPSAPSEAPGGETHKEAGAALMRLFGSFGSDPSSSNLPSSSAAIQHFAASNSGMFVTQQLQQLLANTPTLSQNPSLPGLASASNTSSSNSSSSIANITSNNVNLLSMNTGGNMMNNNSNNSPTTSRNNPGNTQPQNGQQSQQQQQLQLPGLNGVVSAELQNILVTLRRQEDALMQRYDELVRYEYILKQREAACVHREMELSELCGRLMLVHQQQQNAQQQQVQQQQVQQQQVQQQLQLSPHMQAALFAQQQQALAMVAAQQHLLAAANASSLSPSNSGANSGANSPAPSHSHHLPNTNSSQQTSASSSDSSSQMKPE